MGKTYVHTRQVEGKGGQCEPPATDKAFYLLGLMIGLACLATLTAGEAMRPMYSMHLCQSISHVQLFGTSSACLVRFHSTVIV